MTKANTLIDQYLAHKAAIDSAQEAVKKAQTASRDVLRQILTGQGKGPHDIGGKPCLIVDRSGTLCLMPALRPKVQRKPKEPKEAKAPKEPKKTAAKTSKGSTASAVV